MCEDVGDGSRFMQADYNIDCSSSRYQSSRSFATLMVLVYPAGVPMAYFALLYYGRNPDSRVAEEATAVSQLAPPPIVCVVTDHTCQLLNSYAPATNRSSGIGKWWNARASSR